MADTPADPVVPTEQIPSVKGALSGIASAGAPFIFIDEFPNSGYYNGIAHITCEAIRFTTINNSVVTDRITVAHLRMNAQALKALKMAIENIDKMVIRDAERIAALATKS